MGRLEAIWIKRARKGPMDRHEEARAVEDRGLVGNANQGGRRQVTVIEEEVFEQLSRELGVEIDPSVRRANLMVTGVRLQESRGRILKVGGMRLKIEGETTPCEMLEEVVPGLQNAMKPDWRGGAYGVVLNDSEVRLGDRVDWESPGDQ